MLGKLMKYEFMATGRVFLPLFAALLIVSVINRIFQSLELQVPSVLGIILSVVLIVGICVLTLIITLQRFRNNLLSNEGYLMMTLPVSTNSLILSKLFVAAIWTVVSFVVVVASVMIMAMSGIDLQDIVISARLFFNNILAETTLESTHLVVFSIEAVVCIILSVLSGILFLYACMSLSMLVNKRRWLFTFGAYVVISTALQILFSVLVAIGAAAGITEVFDFSAWNTFGLSQMIILIFLVIEAALCVAYYYVTRYMLKRRLNLL